MAFSGRGPMPRAARPTCPVCQKPESARYSPVRCKALLDGGPRPSTQLAPMQRSGKRAHDSSEEDGEQSLARLAVGDQDPGIEYDERVRGLRAPVNDGVRAASKSHGGRDDLTRDRYASSRRDWSPGNSQERVVTTLG